MSPLLPWLLLVGCGERSAPSLADCPADDLPCLKARATEAWPQDSRTVRRQLEAISDPLVRASLVEALVEAHPSQAKGLCETLDQGITRGRCERIRERPHLWQVAVGDAGSGDAFSGEGSVVLRPSPSFRPATPKTVRRVECGPTVPDNTCRSQRAHEAAMGGDLLAASETCAGITDPRWQGECLFEAVERACSADRPGPCGSAVELCAQAGPFRTPCLVQVAGELASLAPAAASESGNDWATIAGRLREARQRLQPIDPILADRFLHRTWAEALMLSYGTARQIGGNPLDFVPAEAAAHVRAGIAWRLSTQRDSGTLEQRAAHVLAAEQRRTRDPIVVPMQLGRIKIPTHWIVDLPGEEEFPWVTFLQDARRAVSSDPRVDARICVLESAARAYPMDLDMLVEGLGDEEVVVRWTAARLLAAVRPGHPSLGHVANDPDPRVAARASGAGLGR